MGEWDQMSEDLTAEAAEEIARAAADQPDSEKYGLTEQEGRKEGAWIDIPHEAGEAEPRRLQYRKLGEAKEWKGDLPEGTKQKAETDSEEEGKGAVPGG